MNITLFTNHIVHVNYILYICIIKVKQKAIRYETLQLKQDNERSPSD